MALELMKSLYDVDCKIYEHEEYKLYKFPIQIPKDDRTHSRLTAILVTVCKDRVSLAYELRRFIDQRRVKNKSPMKGGKTHVMKKVEKAFFSKGGERLCMSFRKDKFTPYYLSRAGKRKRSFRIFNIKNKPEKLKQMVATWATSLYPDRPAEYGEYTRTRNPQAASVMRAVRDIVHREIVKRGYSYEI